MIIDQTYLYYLWEKSTFQLMHKNAIWILLVLFLTAASAWHLSKLLSKHNARGKEAKLARKLAFSYMCCALALWLLGFIA